ncbi:MAG TPA: TylF/MycF/NovP-related O-methyltransferase [Candidatus Saccharimonadales bacterium]|nr:TylF/MycF/NovP-related O-methyltransferase [Candidatus Saccharimonadales bacterium]
MFEKLLDSYPIISDQISRPSLHVVLRELAQVLEQETTGDIAEFGCYIGTTSLFIRRFLDETGQSAQRQYYAYDSFAGLPPKTIQDASAAGSAFKAGELKVSKKQFLREFNRAHLVPPITHKAWFNELHDSQLPETIAFAFLDGDFYESILDSLHLTWPRLSVGGTITIDDYGRETLPGVERAVRDFFGGNPPAVHHEHNIGILRKS